MLQLVLTASCTHFTGLTSWSPHTLQHLRICAGLMQQTAEMETLSELVTHSIPLRRLEVLRLLQCQKESHTHREYYSHHRERDHVHDIGENISGGMEADLIMQSCSSLAALGGGLGGLCAIPAIFFMGVVIWSCNKRSNLVER